MGLVRYEYLFKWGSLVSLIISILASLIVVAMLTNLIFFSQAQFGFEIRTLRHGHLHGTCCNGPIPPPRLLSLCCRKVRGHWFRTFTPLRVCVGWLPHVWPLSSGSNLGRSLLEDTRLFRFVGYGLRYRQCPYMHIEQPGRLYPRHHEGYCRTHYHHNDA